MKFLVENLYYDYQNMPVLANINLELHKNEIIAIIGASGCGKSTLLKIICQILPYKNGNILLNNSPISKGDINYMPQEDLLFPWRKLSDNIILPYQIHKKKIDFKYVNELIKLFGLGGYENFYPHQLSGGMKKRVALLRSYLNGGKIFLLDEPFSALDAITKKKMHSWLLEVKRQLNFSVILVTHDIKEALFLSKRVYVLSGSPATIKGEFDRHLTAKESDILKLID